MKRRAGGLGFWKTPPARDGGLGARQQHRVRRSARLGRGAVQQGGLEVGQFGQHPPIDLLVEPAGGPTGQRLGREGVAIARGQAQEVTGKQEPDDLPASVGQKLVDPHRTGGDVEQVGRRIPLADENLAGCEVLMIRDAGQPPQALVGQHAADAQLARAAQAAWVDPAVIGAGRGLNGSGHGGVSQRIGKLDADQRSRRSVLRA